jgi:hypothetical protein
VSCPCVRQRQHRTPDLRVATPGNTWARAKQVVPELEPQNLELRRERTAVEFHHSVREAAPSKLLGILVDTNVQ